MKPLPYSIHTYIHTYDFKTEIYLSQLKFKSLCNISRNESYETLRKRKHLFINFIHMHTYVRTYMRTYKVVQIWPGLFVCKQVTVCPGHIWTTLYIRTFLYIYIYTYVYIYTYKHVYLHYTYTVGQDISVGIDTRHGLDGVEIEFRWRQVLPHSSRPALGLTMPPIKRVQVPFHGGKAAGAWR